MSFAASDPQNQGNHAQPEARAAESNLLDRVLRQTLELCESGEPIQPAEMQALRDVAERYRGRPLELEPVAAELVAAVVGGVCPAKKKSEFWRNVSLQVARTLMDDPSAFARLNSFWIRLGGGET